MGNYKSYLFIGASFLVGNLIAGPTFSAEVYFVNNSKVEELDWYLIRDSMDYYLCSSSPGGGSCSQTFSPGMVDFVAENWDGEVVCDVWKAFKIKEGQRANVVTYPDDCR